MTESENSQPLSNGDANVLEQSMEELATMSMEERREFYQTFSALVLFRHLISKNLVEKDTKKEDIAMLIGSDVETGSGISFMYDIRGSKWEVFLHRAEEHKATIEEKEAEVERLETALNDLDDESEERAEPERQIKVLNREISILLKDPKLDIMDLTKSAKVVNRNKLFYN